jgi:hypothetical protein
MSKEHEVPSGEKEEREQRSGLRIAQVVAAALAAVTAAFLGSTLGVAGTITGAGLASVISTVGGEVYLRSLRSTRKAALRAREVVTSGIRRQPGLAEQPTEPLPQPDVETAPPQEKRRRLRWPLIIGISAVAFALAIGSIVGFVKVSGTEVGGGSGPAIGKFFGGRPQQAPTQVPVTSVTSTPSQPATPTPTESTPPPTTSSSTPPTSSTPPSTTTPPSSTTTPPPSSASPTNKPQ